MSEVLKTPISCPNPVCRVAETGKCVEGLEIGNCPHQKAATRALQSLGGLGNEAQAEGVTNEEEIPLLSGEALTIGEATAVLCSGPSRVLTIIGPQDAGKTTFCLSLYQAFKDGSFGPWNFGGSLTITAFERGGHLSQAACGQARPHTLRTSLGEGLGFLHLAVHSERTGLLNLLVSDRSGEAYSSLADGLEDYENLPELKRADFVLLLLDGAKMIGAERHGVKTDVLMMLASLAEGVTKGKMARIGLVLTKFDLVVTKRKKVQVLEFFNELTENARTRFGSSIQGLGSFVISARPENPSVEPRYGFLQLLEEGLSPTSVCPYASPAIPLLERAFLKIGLNDGRSA